MADLRATSRAHAARIRSIYANQVRGLELPDRNALRTAHRTGLLTPLAASSTLTDSYNLTLRVAGRHPIGEMDLAHQELYLAARPETIGCLLEVASRVQSGALDVTSLVRHGAYQRALARRNANAVTAVPTHVMGLAFDISVLNAPLATAREIRDVLEGMARAGDLMFIAEQKQVVFHVVPAPARRTFYTALSDLVTTTPPPSLQSAAMNGLVRAASLAPPPPPAPPAVDLEPLRPAHYAGLFGWTVLAGLGLPPGEDLLVAGAGALVGQGLLAWWPVMLLAFAAVVASDTALYWMGRGTARVAPRRGLLPARTAGQLDALVSRWGKLAIAVARFVPGIRAVVYATVGARGIRPGTFLLIDACAALFWVALIVYFGARVMVLLLGGDVVPPHLPL